MWSQQLLLVASVAKQFMHLKGFSPFSVYYVSTVADIQPNEMEGHKEIFRESHLVSYPKASPQLSTGVVHPKAEPPRSPPAIDPDEDTQDAPEDFARSGSDEYIEGSLDGADGNALASPAQHKCPICLRTYLSAVLLEKHKCPGRPEKRYTCHICFRELSREGHLVAHMRVHTGEKPFKCVVCSRAFRQKSNLTVHMQQHTTGGQFQCTACPRSFTRRDYLQTHMQRHHRL
ncbi:hypothetical protein HPB52_001780 [Rhipicephalus sanguineus]|uniref:C2H2-type domain-containing protein n=1 Tax=Rhipicephalus sanguineus TaxID=34632 RepID=A0A9D4QBY4_RHISA|nr:hypothetical protein HPB52_001780 [Rhipicephalus sanguineus]